MPWMLADYHPDYENRPSQAQLQDFGKEKQQQPPIVDTVTDSGGAKAGDAGLIFLDSPGHIVDSVRPYDSIIEPPSATPTSSTSSCLSYPSLPTNVLLAPNNLTEENLPTIANINPSLLSHNASALKELCPPLPLLDLHQEAPKLESTPLPVKQSGPALEQGFCPKEATDHLPNLLPFLLNEPRYEQQLPPSCARMLATPVDSFTYPRLQRSHPNEAARDIAGPQAILHDIQPKHEQHISMPAMNQHAIQVLPGQSSYVIPPNDFNSPSQDSVENFFERRYPKTGYVLPIDCLDLAGSNRQPHNSLLQSRLPMLQGYGHNPSMPVYPNRNELDPRAYFPHQHVAKLDSFMLPFDPSIIYNSPNIEPTSLYTTEDLQDPSLSGYEILTDQHSNVLQEIRPYSKEEKSERIERYRAKRNKRNFNKTIKYACRKTLADSRPRIKGRFAKTDDT